MQIIALIYIIRHCMLYFKAFNKRIDVPSTIDRINLDLDSFRLKMPNHMVIFGIMFEMEIILKCPFSLHQ